jgi:uncharacterized protein (DUF934 family)
MDNLKFSVTTITADEWYEHARNDAINELTARVLVVATDSALEFLDGPLDSLERIVVTSIDFNDGRFFSIGRLIRLNGYSGHLTVVGNILPDQYTALRFCGFDDVLSLDDVSATRVVALDKALTLPGVVNPVNQQLEPLSATGTSQ